MRTLFEALRAALARGEQAVLCCIIASSGSAPRGKGAKMAVFRDGSTCGTIGGGAVELQSIGRARQVLQDGVSLTHAFILTPNQVEDIGMICGGNVTVSFQLLTPAQLPLLDAVLQLLQSGQQRSWLITVLRDGLFQELGLYDEEHGLRFTTAIDPSRLQPMLGSGGALYKGDPAFYVEPLTQPGAVYLFGGGHVGQALAPMLHMAGFRVVVYDDRPHAANSAVFPQADRIVLGSYDDIASQVQLTAADAVVIMTPGHKSDLALLKQALRTPAAYVGCIGSRHKVARTRQALLEDGIPPEAFSRLHSPIGLDLGGETPAEVAVSVTAELVAHRSGKLYSQPWPQRP